jgi:hypothetical protein
MLQVVKEMIQERATSIIERTGEVDVNDWWEEIREEFMYYSPKDATTTFSMFSAATLLALLPNLQELACMCSRVHLRTRDIANMYPYLVHPAWPGDRLGIPTRMRASIALTSSAQRDIRATAFKRWDKVSTVLQSLTLSARSSADGTPPSDMDKSLARYSSLERLKTILPFSTRGQHEHCSMADLESFLILPNLQNLFSVSMTDEDPVPLFDWTDRFSGNDIFIKGTTSLNLRRLEIVYGCCTPEGIASLLVDCHYLEVFKYAHESKYMMGADFDASNFVYVVGKCVGAILKEFALRLLELDLELEVVNTFKTLSVLEEIELDMRLFNDYFEECDSVRPLFTMPPQSIRCVILNLDDQVALTTLRRLVEGLGQAKYEKLPKLEEVTVRAQKDVEDEQGHVVRAFAEEQGVLWEVPDLRPYDWHSVGWVGEFCRSYCVVR